MIIGYNNIITNFNRLETLINFCIANLYHLSIEAHACFPISDLKYARPPFLFIPKIYQ
jgi:hypothetical protein